IAVRYWESTMRRSSSRARGSGAAERSMAAPEFQKADQCFSAAAKVAAGGAGFSLSIRAKLGLFSPAPSKAQQKARRSLVGVRTKRWADSCLMAAATPGQAMLT